MIVGIDLSMVLSYCCLLSVIFGIAINQPTIHSQLRTVRMQVHGRPLHRNDDSLLGLHRTGGAVEKLLGTGNMAVGRFAAVAMACPCWDP